MILYRICRRHYAKDLTGTGAGLYGGRWNPPGVNMLYTAGSISLACLEYLVHNFHLMAAEDICLVKVFIKHEKSIHEVKQVDLSADWQETSYLPETTQLIGSSFILESKSYILKVPSAVVPDEYNYLLNPHHPYHAGTYIQQLIDPFKMDSRLFTE